MSAQFASFADAKHVEAEVDFQCYAKTGEAVLRIITRDANVSIHRLTPHQLISLGRQLVRFGRNYLEQRNEIVDGHRILATVP